MDYITTRENGEVSSMVGRDAVEVARLAVILSGLRLEIRCPGMKLTRHMSALAAAKQATGLRTNKREVQLARIELMLKAAKRAVVYVKEGEMQP